MQVPIEVLGWAGNGFYFARFAWQWWSAERARASVAPTVFWWLSLFGALSLGTYSFLIGEAPLFLGYVLTLAIYARNISIAHLGRRAGRLAPLPTAFVALLAAATLIVIGALPKETDGLTGAWLALGFVGQMIFSSRFVVQWYATERAGHAHFPRSFWWLSLVGNLALLAYAVRLGDPVYIAGFALGPFVQVRNLMLPTEGRLTGA